MNIAKQISKNINQYRRAERGFTLIETMVAISIFTIIITMGTAAVLNTNAVYRKATATRALIDNLSFVMEDMTRNLRLGSDYTCPSSNPPSPVQGGSCTGDNISISFSDVEGKPSGYLIGPDINDSTTNIISKYDPAISDFAPISSPEFKIDISKSGFTVSGVGVGDNAQPMVTIRLSGHIEIKGETTEFNLQTSVSQRELEE